MQSAIKGRTVRITIGKHGLYTPDAARKKARDARSALEGINPNQKKKEERADQITLQTRWRNICKPGVVQPA